MGVRNRLIDLMILQVGSSILKYGMGDEGGSTVNVTDASRKIFLTLAVKPSDLQDQLEYSFQRSRLYPVYLFKLDSSLPKWKQFNYYVARKICFPLL